MLLALVMVLGHMPAPVFAADINLDYIGYEVNLDDSSYYTEENALPEPEAQEPVPELEPPDLDIYITTACTYALNAIIEEAEDLTQAAFTPRSWQLLQSALAAARHISGSPNATEHQIDEAKSALRLVIDSLVLLADKSGLSAAIEDAKQQLHSEHTDESWATLQIALMAARIVYSDENATQDDVDDVTSILWEAIHGPLPSPINVKNAGAPIGQVFVRIEDPTPTPLGQDWPDARGLMHEGWVNLYEADSMMDTIVRLAAQRGWTVYGASSNFITSIDGLSVFDRGSSSGWMGTLNDWFSNLGFNAFTVADGTLADGDLITVYFTLELGEDLGASWGNDIKTLRGLELSTGTLTPVFHEDIREYTLEIADGVNSVIVNPTATNRNFQARISVDGTEFPRTRAISVENGTVITVRIGDPAWPSMNLTTTPAEVYTITVVAPGSGDEINWTALNTAIADAQSRTESDYTPESWAEVQDALASALTVRDNAAATQTAVNNAESSLSSAISALVRVDIPSEDSYVDGWFIVHNPNGQLVDRLLAIVEDKYSLPPLILNTGNTNADLRANANLIRTRLAVVERVRIIGEMSVADFLDRGSNSTMNPVPGPFSDWNDNPVNGRPILNSVIEIDMAGLTSITGTNNNVYPIAAFRGMQHVERVRLPAHIGFSSSMFIRAPRLNTIVFGNGEFIDGVLDFRGLEIINFEGTTHHFNAAGGVREVIFPVGITNIPNNMFNNNPLQTVHFYGETAPTIGTNAITSRPVAIVPDNTTGGFELSEFFNHFSQVDSRDVAGIDRTELNAVINKARALNESNFTAETWAVFVTTLLDAESALTIATSQAQINEAVLNLRTAIDALEVRDTNVTFLNVPEGARVGAFQKTGNHFTAFVSFPMSLDAEMSGDGRDVWRAAIPTGIAFHIEAYIPGQTAKIAQRMNALSAHGTTVTLEPTPLSEWVNGHGLAWHNANIYTNLGDSGTLNLAHGQSFDLDTFRVWQAMDGVLLNYFIEPEYTFEVFGGSVETQRIGTPGREQLRITALEPGVSVIKITFGPVEYVRANGSSLFFDGIDPRNTLAVVVNVDGGANFDTGIIVRNDFDTYYFDQAIGYREFSFTPAAGSSVRVHEPLNISTWGGGWVNYTANIDGSFTVHLRDGRNIIEVSHEGSVRHHLIHARGVSVNVVNTTRPGHDFIVGDTAQISISGMMKPVEKLAGIYNPGFAGFGTNLRAFIRYSDGITSVDSARNSVGQYTTLTDTFTVNFALSDTDLNVLDGRIHVGHMGSPLGAHRNIPLGGVPANMNAVEVGPFAFGGLPVIVLPIEGTSEPADRTALNTSITEAESRVEGNYTTDSWAQMQNALAMAIAVRDNVDATQAQIDTALDELEAAMSALVLVSAGPMGSGSASDPYMLITSAHLVWLQEEVAGGRTFNNLFVKLGADIELDADWVPIGTGRTAAQRFLGTFDGGGFTISFARGSAPLFHWAGNVRNLNIFGEYIAGPGLAVSGDNNIQNVNISNVRILSGTTIRESGFFNLMGGGTIRNNYIESNVRIGWDADTDAPFQWPVRGAFTGGAASGSFVAAFAGTAEGNVSHATVFGQNQVGGIVGIREFAMRTSTLRNNEFHGEIIATGNMVGGIMGAGYNHSSAPNTPGAVIENNLVTGIITGGDRVGGIFGGETSNQKWGNGVGRVTGNTFEGRVSATNGYVVGGIIGYLRSLNRNNIIANNTFTYISGGPTRAIGGVDIVDTIHPNPTPMAGVTIPNVIYFTTQGTTAVNPVPPGFSGITQRNHYRTDDPLGADADSLGKMIGAPVVTDKTVLITLIAEAEERDADSYTAESWALFAAALEEAKNVAANTSATQAEIDAATDTLRSAKDDLVRLILPTTWEVAMRRGLERIVTAVPSPDFGSVGGEWAILALARGEHSVPDGYFEEYLQRIGAQLDGLAEHTDPNHTAAGWVLNPNNGRREVRLATHQSTENARLIVALTSLGVDATSFVHNGNTYDFVARLGNRHSETSNAMWGVNQGINGPIWNLIALNSRGWDAPYQISDRTWVGGSTSSNPITLDEMIQWVLDVQLNNGGWHLSHFNSSNANTVNSVSDPDMTAMAIQALAPYRSRPNVNAAINRALEELRRTQEPSGGWAGNVQSSAQVIVALTSLGIDPASNDWTTSSGNNPIDAVLSFHDEATGGFRHGGQIDLMATEQATYALVAYWRFVSDRNALYDMGDAFTRVPPVNWQMLDAAIADAGGRIESNYTPSSWANMQTALTVAINVRSDSSATQTQVDAAASVLRAAIDALVSVAGNVDRTELDAVITDAQGRVESNYTRSSWDVMQNELVAAIAVRDNADATQEDVDSATSSLSSTLNSLVRVDRTLLNAAIADAQSRIQSNYTSESWNQMQSALIDAVQVHDYDNATQAQIDAAANNLRTAINNLAGNNDGSTARARISVVDPNAREGQTSTFFAEQEFVLEPNDTAYSLLRRTGLSIQSRGHSEFAGMYVQSINGWGEFSDGPLSGWMFRVNGNFPNFSASLYPLQDGDRVEWLFTRDLGNDIGAAGVNRVSLNAAIADAQARVESNYTRSSWNAMRNELAAAIAVRDNADATQEDVDYAASRLFGALGALVKINRTMLNAAIIDAQARVESNYTRSSWNVMQHELSEAIAVHDDADATQEDVDYAASRLFGALGALVKINRTMLNAAIIDAQARVESNYTRSSWNAMRSVLVAAIIVRDNADAMQENVDYATSRLLGALDALVRINRTMLNAAINDAQARVESNYTRSSWNAMRSVLEAANIVHDNADATQEDVDYAASRLLDAIDSLVPDNSGGNNNNGSTTRARISVIDPNAGAGQTRTFFAEQEFLLEPGETAYSLLRRTGLSIQSRGHSEFAGMYVQSINGWGEFSDGPLSGWMFRVNGNFPNFSASLYPLQEGDRVEWLFTRDLGNDIGGGFGGVSRTALNTAITDAEDRVQANYTSTSWSVLHSALTAARQAHGNANATQAQIDTAVSNLRSAINNLVSTTGTGRSALGSAIADAEARLQANYTIASWARMQSALAAAITIRDDANATPAQITTATERLREAIAALEVRVGVSVPPTTDPGSSTAVAEVEPEIISNLTNQAVDAGATNITITIPVPGGISRVEAELTVGSLNEMVSSELSLTIHSNISTIILDTKTLSGLTNGVDDDVLVRIVVELLSGTYALNENQRTVAGDNLVARILIYVGYNQIHFVDGILTIAIPYNPRISAEDHDLLTVYHLDSYGNIREMKDANYSGSQILFTTYYLSLFFVSEWISPFSDVTREAWHLRSVRFAYASELMNGTGAGQFSPDMNITRAMIVTILWRIEGSPVTASEGTFSDVTPNAWYASAVAWANESGIVSGVGNGTFAPDDIASREQLAVILQNYAQFKGIDTTAGTFMLEFSDVDNVSPWALSAMQWANSNDIIRGRTLTTLAPSGAATRAETAAMLQQFVQGLM